MASITFCIFFFTLTSALAAEYITNPHLFCYICESQKTDACDPPKVSSLTSADCSALSYTNFSNVENRDLVTKVLASSINDRFEGTPLIQEILQDETLHPRQVNYTYYCLAVRMEHGKNRSFTRTCAKLPSNVKDPCDYMRQEIDSPIKVTFCSACTKTNCNHSNNLLVSIGLIVFIIFVNLFA